MDGDYVCYGQINVDVKEEALPLIRKLVNRTSFTMTAFDDIIHPGGTDGARGLFTYFKELIETLYEQVADAGYDTEDFTFSMFGKIIVDFVDYFDAYNVMVMSVNYNREIKVFPDNG